MAETTIEWTDATWNPTTGCTRASAGCDHCYAFTMTKRLAAIGQEKYQGLAGNGHFNGVLKTWDDELQKPLHWKKPRMIFVNSMSDLFHKDVPFDFVDKVFAVMALCPQHTFQVLTKRAERMAEYMASRSKSSKYWEQSCPVGYALRWEHDGKSHPLCRFPLPNVWLGVSAENQERWDERVRWLSRVPAAVRFVSAEPLLGPIQPSLSDDVHWVISGGESGPNARPSHPDWHRTLRKFCQAFDVAYLFKQWGEWLPVDQWNGDEFNGQSLALRHDGETFGPREPHGFCCANCSVAEVLRLGKKKSGRLLDGREWNEFPKTESAACP